MYYKKLFKNRYCTDTGQKKKVYTRIAKIIIIPFFSRIYFIEFIGLVEMLNNNLLIVKMM